METAFYILACLLLPILWGVLVHYLFNYWDKSQSPRKQAGPPDFQI